jgi:hypothetical protein
MSVNSIWKNLKIFHKLTFVNYTPKDCFAQGTGRKPACPVPECAG